MQSEFIYLICGSALFGLGLYYLIIGPEAIRRILAINIIGLGVFMLLTVTSISVSGIVDPIPQAMVLTGIVVAVAASALTLAMVCRVDEVSAESSVGESN